MKTIKENKLAHFKCCHCEKEFQLQAQVTECIFCGWNWIEWLNYSDDWCKEEN